MKITKQQDYAILFMTILAVKTEKRISVQEVANDFNIPYYFLKKIARHLKKANLVDAKEGSAGGYALTLPAAEITLAEIIEAISGPIVLNDCSDPDKECRSGNFCPTCQVMKRLSREMRHLFSSVKLTDMIAASPISVD